ncbi:hypothetical protein DB346_11630 [Verrucomicrobia bacterium LW23]|nr:hypothetical protein DB346_11630 [Verrucomicrobia bacterium LW23]
MLISPAAPLQGPASGLPASAQPSRWWACLALLALLMLGGAATAAHAQMTVRAMITPKEIKLGRGAFLDVTVEGAGSPVIEVVAVDGLKIDEISTETLEVVNNGIRTDTHIYRYLVQPLREGDFTIPAVVVKAGTTTVRSAPVNLRVLPATRSSSRLTTTAPSATTTTPGATATGRASPARTAAPAGQGREALLELVMPRHELYVGELIPVSLKLYTTTSNHSIRNLSGLPTLTSDAFSLTKLTGDPTRANDVVDGDYYNVLTWESSLSPVKAGDFEVGMQADLQMLERTRVPVGPDKDPRYMMWMQRLVDRKFKSPANKVKVLPLPAAGRPATFTGAVGQFQVSATASPARVSVGEPVMLRFEVWGTGNFDRVNAPVGAPMDGWKLYPSSAKPQVDEATGTTGRKIFEIAAVPTKGGLPGLMPFSFSYFDPKTRKYISQDVVMPRITIQGESAPRDPAPDAPRRAGEPEPAPLDPLGIAPIRTQLSPFVASLTPVALDPVYMAGHLAPLAFFAFALLMGRRRSYLQGADYKRTSALRQQYRSQQRLMDDAVARDDSAAFFTAAKAALQLQLAYKWKLKPGEITMQLVEERDPAIAEEIHVIFDKADELAYAGPSADAYSLRDWKQMVESQLDALQ